MKKQLRTAYLAVCAISGLVSPSVSEDKKTPSEQQDERLPAFIVVVILFVVGKILFSIARWCARLFGTPKNGARVSLSSSS